MNQSNWGKFWRAAGALVLLVMLAAGQASTAAAAERMTREKVLEYYARFNAEDERYAEFLTDDVVYPHPTGVTFHGPKEIVDYYKKFWATGIKETREPGTIIIDNDAGLIAVELTVHIVAKPGMTPKLPSGEAVKPGEEWVGNNVMIYTLRNGKISSIRGGRSSPIKLLSKP